jgi:hypothetical protein
LAGALRESSNTSRCIRIVGWRFHQHTDATHPLRLLRPRPRGPTTAAPPSPVMKSRRCMYAPADRVSLQHSVGRRYGLTWWRASIWGKMMAYTDGAAVRIGRNRRQSDGD